MLLPGTAAGGSAYSLLRKQTSQCDVKPGCTNTRTMYNDTFSIVYPTMPPHTDCACQAGSLSTTFWLPSRTALPLYLLAPSIWLSALINLLATDMSGGTAPCFTIYGTTCMQLCKLRSFVMRLVFICPCSDMTSVVDVDDRSACDKYHTPADCYIHIPVRKGKRVMRHVPYGRHQG